MLRLRIRSNEAENKNKGERSDHHEYLFKVEFRKKSSFDRLNSCWFIDHMTSFIHDSELMHFILEPIEPFRITLVTNLLDALLKIILILI